MCAFNVQLLESQNVTPPLNCTEKVTSTDIGRLQQAPPLRGPSPLLSLQESGLCSQPGFRQHSVGWVPGSLLIGVGRQKVLVLTFK